MEAERALYRRALIAVTHRMTPMARLTVSSLGIVGLLDQLTDAQIRELGDAICAFADEIRRVRASGADPH